MLRSPSSGGLTDCVLLLRYYWTEMFEVYLTMAVSSLIESTEA